MKTELINEIRSVEKFFNTSTSCLTEKDSSFRPVSASMSVAEQVAHAAQTIDWFIDALSNPKGFDLDFEKHTAEVKKVVSLTDARTLFSKSIQNAVKAIEKLSDEQLNSPLPQGPVMGGAPKYTVVGAMVDHTAHHRGALTVYSRLLGKVPEMPYA